MKMAYLPKRSKLILNSVSAAPGFNIKNVLVMAGVPKIMQDMFVNSVEPNLKKGKITHAISIKVNIPEALLSLPEIIGKVELYQQIFMNLSSDGINEDKIEWLLDLLKVRINS